VADLARTPIRLAVVLAVAVVALFEVLTLLQGVRSTQRLQARATHDVQRAVEDARGQLVVGLEERGPRSWRAVATRAVQRELAAEVEVLDPQGRVLLAHPVPPPVSHTLSPEDRVRVDRGRVLTFVVGSGTSLRALSYLGFDSGGRSLLLRLATPVPDLEEERQERRQILLGHGAALGALLLAAVLVLLPPRPVPSRASRGALHAYEEAVELLRDRDQEMTARHEAERQRMEDALREKEAFARAGELTAGIVHEVRNGLGTIVGYARLLERAEPGVDAGDAARSIREECETLETVVRRFSEFIRVERLNLSELDLARLLSRVVSREVRGAETVSVSLVGLDESLPVRGDEELLERAFENLVRNAVEAVGEGPGRIEIEAQADLGELEIRISDDGPGLSPDHPGEIRPFFTTRTGGLGLGLPLARKILLLHAGSLELLEGPEGGVTVLVILPVLPVRGLEV
jgi:signal transduction histidine kinase